MIFVCGIMHYGLFRIRYEQINLGEIYHIDRLIDSSWIEINYRHTINGAIIFMNEYTRGS